MLVGTAATSKRKRESRHVSICLTSRPMIRWNTEATSLQASISRYKERPTIGTTVVTRIKGDAMGKGRVWQTGSARGCNVKLERPPFFWFILLRYLCFLPFSISSESQPRELCVSQKRIQTIATPSTGENARAKVERGCSFLVDLDESTLPFLAFLVHRNRHGPAAVSTRDLNHEDARLEIRGHKVGADSMLERDLSGKGTCVVFLNKHLFRASLGSLRELAADVDRVGIVFKGDEDVLLLNSGNGRINPVGLGSQTDADRRTLQPAL